VGFLVYVTLEDDKGVSRLPPSILCSHYHIVFAHLKLKKGDKNEEALRRVARMSNRRDLVEEFIACGVWSLVHGWNVGCGKVGCCLFAMLCSWSRARSCVGWVLLRRPDPSPAGLRSLIRLLMRLDFSLVELF
jgi:hypothetical protein